MKKYILTLAAFFFLSMILFGQNPTNSFLEKFRIRPSGLTEEPYFSIDGLSELDQVRKFQLDSIIHGYYDYVNEKFIEKSGKDEFTYDENGFPETTVILGFRDGEYKPSLRYLFDFNQDGNMLEFLLQDWNSNSLKWEDYNKRTYSYNEEGSLIEMLYYEVDYGPELELMDRIIFTYDSSGNLLSRLLQATQSGSWYDQTESRYTYDENSNKTSYSYWVSDFGESGKELIRTEYGYDSTGRLTYEIEYENNGYEGGLRPYQKDSFVYDENNRLKTEISSHNEEGDWNAELKKEYSYNSSDIPYLIHWLVAEDGVNWILITQEDILLDENDNILLITFSSVSLFDENNLLPSRKMEFDRTEEIVIDNLTAGSITWLETNAFTDVNFKGFQMGHHAVSRYGFYRWDDFNQQWEDEYGNGESFFYYSALSTTDTDEELFSSKLLIYPNPTDRLLTIETDLTNAPFDLYLYNMFGQRVFRKSISSQEQIVLPTLPEGIYVLQLSKESEVLGSRRIIIRH